MGVKRIFLDLDGVVRAWDDAVIKLYNLRMNQSEITHWGSIYERAQALYNMSLQEFWDGQGEDFWLNLEFTPEATDVLCLLEKTKKDIVLLTAPTMNNAGWGQQWIRKHMPSYFYKQKYIIGPCKYVCANSQSMLVDDAEKNIDPWIESGGVGFLFPRPWNRMRELAANPVRELEDHLVGLKLL